MWRIFANQDRFEPQKIKEIMADADGDRQAMRGKMKEIREAHKVELQKYLTSEQFEAWEKVQKERRGKRRDRRGQKPDLEPNIN